MRTDITCFILSGGASSRMGFNKSLLELGRKNMLEIILDKVRPLFEEIVLITNSPQEYEYPEIRMIGDILKGKGPISGIHSGLAHSDTERNLFMTCDMPLLKKETISKLAEFQTSKLITVFSEEEYAHPLPGIYSKSLLPGIEDIIKKETGYKNQKFKLLNFLKEENTKKIYKEKSYEFFNVNTPQDFKKLKELFTGNTELL